MSVPGFLLLFPYYTACVLDDETFNEHNAAQFENMGSSFDFWRIMHEVIHFRGERIPYFLLSFISTVCLHEFYLYRMRIKR
jgi:hypothetical protein